MYSNRPQNVTKAILSSLKVYQKSAHKILILSLLWGIVWQGILLTGRFIVIGHHQLGQNLYWQLIVSVLLSCFVLIWLGGGMYDLMHRCAQNNSLSIGQSLWRVKSVLIHLILTFLFFIIIFFILAQISQWTGVFLWHSTNLDINIIKFIILAEFAVLSIIFSIYCLLIEPLIVVNQYGFIKALKHSIGYICGCFWYSFAVMFWPLLGLLVVYNFVPISLNFAQGMTPVKLFWVQRAVTIITAMIFMPWVISSVLVVLHNIKPPEPSYTDDVSEQAAEADNTQDEQSYEQDEGFTEQASDDYFEDESDYK